MRKHSELRPMIAAVIIGHDPKKCAQFFLTNAERL